METAEEDPFAEIDILVKALSEMAEPCGYFVQAELAAYWRPRLDIMRPDGKWMGTMCITLPKDCSFSFLDRKSAAAALVSNYESSLTWDAQFFNNWEALRFPGGSPEELALKAAAGVKARFDPDIDSPENLLADL